MRNRISKRLENAFSIAHRRDKLIEQNFMCKYCYSILTQREATIDHVKPKIKGGLNEKENMVVSCVQCNKCKGSMNLTDFYRAIEVSNELPFVLLRFRRNMWTKVHNASYRIKTASGIKCSKPNFAKIRKQHYHELINIAM